MGIRTACWLSLWFVAVGLIACSCGRNPPEARQTTNQVETEYKTVLLTNGQVFVGKLEGLGTPYPVLTDVYYVQVRVDPDSQKRSESLVKRGAEWHAPDRTILNASHIVLIEPVTKGSRAMEAIDKLKMSRLP